MIARRALAILSVAAGITLGTIAVETAAATTLVAHRGETEFVIAIDSLVTPISYPSGERRPPFKACKIFEERDAIFAFAGAAPFAVDANRIVRDALQHRTSVRAAAEVIAGRLRTEFDAWLARVDAKFVQDVARQRVRDREVLLSALVLGAQESDGPVGVGIALYVGPKDPPHVRTVKSWACHASACPDPFVVFGQRDTIRRYVGRFRLDAFGATAADQAAGLVQLEIDARAPMVGPPISVAEVGRDGVSWPRPGLCRAAISADPSVGR